MAEIDHREWGPSEDTAMPPWYGGAYSHAFVALHPFFRVGGLDPAFCDQGTLVLQGAAAPEGKDLLASADEKARERSVGRELSAQAVTEVAKRFGEPVGWRAICGEAGFADHCELDRALRTHIRGLKPHLSDEAGAERLVAFCNEHKLFLPTEGALQPLMEDGIAELLERTGVTEVVVSDQFGDDRRLVSSSALRTEGTWNLQPGLPPTGIGLLFAPDHSLLLWVHWDSFYTTIFGTEQRLRGARLGELFEGFWCDDTTHTYGLTQPCITLTQ